MVASFHFVIIFQLLELSTFPYLYTNINIFRLSPTFSLKNAMRSCRVFFNRTSLSNSIPCSWCFTLSKSTTQSIQTVKRRERGYTKNKGMITDPEENIIYWPFVFPVEHPQTSSSSTILLLAYGPSSFSDWHVPSVFVPCNESILFWSDNFL